jgi:hypothetical protein
MQEISNVNDIGLYFTLTMGVLILVLPRRVAIIPLLLTALYLTQGQVVVVATLHFTMIRVMLLLGMTRVILRNEISAIKLNTIDKIFILWVISSVIVKTLLWQTSDVFVNRLGFAYDAMFSYFIFRCLVQDFDDITRLFKTLAIIIVPLTVAMIVETSTGRNFFSIFGGVPEFSEFRAGRVRCEGAFRHPILAGSFGAASMPLFVSIWFKDGSHNKIIGIIGFICATMIMILANSSGPLMAYFFGLIALLLWSFRKSMRMIRWGILISLLFLHMVMKAPVWFLMARLAELTGGSGWHRSELISQAVDHFNEWWLLGTKSTLHWMDSQLSVNESSIDITNHFVGVGVNGGLISLVLFIMIIVYCYKNLGRTLQSLGDAPVVMRITLWALGASLTAHIASFMSVSYFDQIIVFWYLLIALISTTASQNFIWEKGKSDIPSLSDHMSTTRSFAGQL